jgi:hypothetical protein
MFVSDPTTRSEGGLTGLVLGVVQWYLDPDCVPLEVRCIRLRTQHARRRSRSIRARKTGSPSIAKFNRALRRRRRAGIETQPTAVSLNQTER